MSHLVKLNLIRETETQMRQTFKFILISILSFAIFTALAIGKPDNRAAAVIDNQIITYQQMTDNIADKLYEAELKVYEVKLNQLNNMLLSRLIESHPLSKGFAPQEFLDKFVIKPKAITDVEIEQFIKANRIPPEQINPELKGKVRDYVKNEKARTAVSKWFAVQSKEHGVVINLTKPQRPRLDVPVGDAPVLGDENAKITIIEYSDFQCPYCAAAESKIKRLQKDYPGNIKLVYKNFPLGFHGEAFSAAEAGLCAREQSNDYFWQLHDVMLADPGGLKRAALKSKVTQLNMDVAKFEKCMDSKTYFSNVNRDIAEGKKFGVNSTPIFFINGIVVKGNKAYKEFTDIIDTELSE